MKSPLHWLKKARLGLAGRVAGIILGGLVASIAVMTVLMGVFIFLGNGEYFERGTQGVVVDGQDGNEAILVTLRIHRMLPDENAVEASLLVNTENFALGRRWPADQPCVTVEVDDRSGQRVFVPKAYQFGCLPDANTLFIGGESPRFLLPAYQSVQSFPFDDIQIWPMIIARTPQNLPRIRYTITKFMPGRVLYVTGDRYNWDVHLGRSPNEKILILVSALLFIGLTLFVTWRISQTALPPTGIQDLVAVASYLVAAVGFRELLGAGRTVGVSAFEIGVFVVPLIALSGGIATAHFRHSPRRSQRRR